MAASSQVLLIFPAQKEETRILKQYVIHHGREMKFYPLLAMLQPTSL
jgi:hypothetical protein